MREYLERPPMPVHKAPTARPKPVKRRPPKAGVIGKALKDRDELYNTLKPKKKR